MSTTYWVSRETADNSAREEDAAIEVERIQSVETFGCLCILRQPLCLM